MVCTRMVAYGCSTSPRTLCMVACRDSTDRFMPCRVQEEGHVVRLHAPGDMQCSRRVLPRAQPAEGSFVLWAASHADVIMICDSSVEMPLLAASGLACLHESLGFPQALCLLQQTLLAQLDLSRYPVVQQLDTLLQLCCLSLHMAP